MHNWLVRSMAKRDDNLKRDPMGLGKKSTSRKQSQSETSEVPKWQQLVPMAGRIWPEQEDFLNDAERLIMRNRAVGEGSERITKNTIIRALITLLADSWKDMDIEGITDEEDLLERIRQIL